MIFFILTGCAPQKAETPINVSVGEAKIPVKVEKIDKIEVEPIIIPEKEEEIVPEPEIDPVREILDSLTLEQKIGQMFIVPLSGETLTDEDRIHLSKRHFGNTFLFGKSTKDVEKIKQLNADADELIENCTSLSPFVFIDQEGGRVRRIKDGITYLPKAKAMGEMSEDEVRELARAAAVDMKNLGITVDAAPVLDVYTNKSNTVIGDRAFGTDAVTVSDIGCAFMDGLTEGGMLACVKHFPGHGDTSEDSHYELPVLAHDMDRLDEIELVPFKAAIDAGCDMMMIAHIVTPALSGDGLPASLSGEVIGFLRNDLGYDGLIVTDSMDMKAVSDTYGTAKASLMAIMAGADMVCASEIYDVQCESYDLVLGAAKDGTIPMETIDAAVYRIIRLKLEYFGLEK